MYVVKVASDWSGDDFERSLNFILATDWLEYHGASVIEYDFNRWYYAYNKGKFAVTADQYVKLIANKCLSVELLAEIKPYSNDFERLLNRTEELINKAGYTEQYNGRCEVHMPGNMLLHFNETLLLEDSCTDKLQDALDKGWRIIAASPQPDQRRPDYILGRYNQSMGLQDGAKRRA